MKIAIASDHAGFELKREIMAYFDKVGTLYEDCGTYSLDSVDYPDFAVRAAEKVLAGDCDRGVLICGTGQGIGMSANKMKGIRCAILSDVFSAKMTALHNDANMIAMGSRVIGAGLAIEIVKTYLNTEFEGGRHIARLEKMAKIEDK